MSKTTQYYIGLMSGTSVDGIDAALVEFDGNLQTEDKENANTLPEFPVLPTAAGRLYHFITHPMAETLKEAIHQLNTQPQISLEALAKLQLELGLAFSGAAQALMMAAGVKTDAVRAIGSHGQTVFHAPHLMGNLGMSLQIGHPAVIAKRTGVTTVGDFRVDDMALGGQGAPLAPAYHRVLFAPLLEQYGTIALVNIGGISNLTLLTPRRTIGFDIGPGNGLMDVVCQQKLGIPYDKNGELAKAGTVDLKLLEQLKQHPFFAQKPPKSTGKETFNLNWLNGFKLPEKTEDLLATLNRFTAELIINAIQALPVQPALILICGGGALNATLMDALKSLSPAPVHSTAEFGVDPNAIEAMLCAWLAHQRLHETPIDLTATTGAPRPTLLGGVWLP